MITDSFGSRKPSTTTLLRRATSTSGFIEHQKQAKNKERNQILCDGHDLLRGARSWLTVNKKVNVFSTYHVMRIVLSL